MAYFIIDEANKSIHDYETVIPRLCQISATDREQKLVLFNEDELRELLLYKNYNGCPFCLKKYYIERKYFEKK